MVISPLSLYLALGLAYEGASGNTKMAMNQVLQILPETKLNLSLANLIDSLKRADPGTTLSIANALWNNQNLGKVKPSFLQAISPFQAESKPLTSHKSTDAQSINRWVKDKTRGTISELVTPADVKDSPLILTNAVYFFSKWANSFDKNLTKEDDFFITPRPKNKVRLPFLNRLAYYQYLPKIKEGQTNPWLQAIRLPYGDKDHDRLEMMVILPKVGVSASDVLASLEKEVFTIPESMWSTEQIDVHLPKLTLENTTAGLEAALTQMGMGDAFKPNKANFRNLLELAPEEKFWISAIKHKTFFKLSEESTEASASTALIFSIETSADFQPEPKTIDFRVDHPFFFAIRDKKTGTLLFLGYVKEPK